MNGPKISNQIFTTEFLGAPGGLNPQLFRKCLILRNQSCGCLKMLAWSFGGVPALFGCTGRPGFDWRVVENELFEFFVPVAQYRGQAASYTPEQHPHKPQKSCTTSRNSRASSCHSICMPFGILTRLIKPCAAVFSFLNSLQGQCTDLNKIKHLG